MHDAPGAEVDIDAALVRALVAEQVPEHAGLAVVEAAAGWDNAIFRLGDELLVRLPRRALAVPLVEHEQRWLPTIAPKLPLPIPVPVYAGRPGHGYPWPWSIGPWLPGDRAAVVPPANLKDAATALGRFLAALHEPAPTDAPENLYRGGPLSDRAAPTAMRIEQLDGMIDRTTVTECWEQLMGTPRWAGPPIWLHGDLHPSNVLVDEGKVSAIIDFGDITSGDPATDLSIGWMLFAPPDRAVFRQAAGPVDDDTWTRARGWALSLALTYLASSAADPIMYAESLRTIDAVLTDHRATI